MSELNKLRWRCRRGTLELDIILSRYLESRYSDADSEERAAFLQLLDCEDTELMRYLMAETDVDSKALSTVIAVIRDLPVDPSPS